MYTLQLNLHVYLLDEKPASGAAAAKQQYEEDSSSEEEARKMKRKVPKIDLVDSSDGDDSPLVPSQSKVRT